MIDFKKLIKRERVELASDLTITIRSTTQAEAKRCAEESKKLHNGKGDGDDFICRLLAVAAEDDQGNPAFASVNEVTQLPEWATLKLSEALNRLRGLDKPEKKSPNGDTPD